MHDFEEIKQKAEILYKSIKAVHCPYFNGTVKFNAKGLDHLKFKGWRKARSQDDQYIRLKLLHLAPQILEKSHTLQGIAEMQNFERQKINNRWEFRLRPVVYHEFIAVMEQIRTRVIVKQVEGGERYFWSIIPNWRINKHNRKRLLHSGRPEED